MKHKILIQGNYGPGGKLPNECIDFIESKGEKYPEILKTRHHPVLIEMFEKFAVFIDEKRPEKGKWLKTTNLFKGGNYQGYYLLDEIEGDSYIITDYDGAEQVKVPNDFNWIKID